MGRVTFAPVALRVFHNRRFADAPGLAIGLAGAGCFSNESGRPMCHARWSRFTTPHLVIRGRGWFRTPHGEHALAAGDMFCPLQGEFVEYADRPESPWTYYWASLSGEGAGPFVGYGGFSSHCHCFPARDPAAVARSWERLLGACAHEEERPLHVFARLLDLMERIRAAAPIPAPDPVEPPAVLRKAVQIADESPHPMNVEELASALHVHRATLHRAFVGGLGTTPIAWLRRRRHEHARRLLAETGLKIGAVAGACGFADPKHFMRAFRQLEGITAATYRRQFSKSNPRLPHDAP